MTRLPLLTLAERIDAISLMIDFMDLQDGDLDLEPEEDSCPAGDDDPASSMARGQHAAMGQSGDPADAEANGDEDEWSVYGAEY